MFSKNLILVLGYMGLIPFYLTLIFFNFKNYNFLVDIFFLYSVVILCFLSGSLWMKTILQSPERKNNLFKILSVSLPMIVLGTELFVIYILKVPIYILIYIIIYICDKKNIKKELNEYLRMRFILTINVIIAHLLMLYSIYSNSLF